MENVQIKICVNKIYTSFSDFQWGNGKLLTQVDKKGLRLSYRSYTNKLLAITRIRELRVSQWSYTNKLLTITRLREIYGNMIIMRYRIKKYLI